MVANKPLLRSKQVFGYIAHVFCARFFEGSTLLFAQAREPVQGKFGDSFIPFAVIAEATLKRLMALVAGIHFGFGFQIRDLVSLGNP